MIWNKFIFNTWIILFLTFCFGIRSFGEQEEGGGMATTGRLYGKLRALAKTNNWVTLDVGYDESGEGLWLFSFGLREHLWIYRAPKDFTINFATLSPDGQRVAFWQSPLHGNSSLYLLEMERRDDHPTKVAEFALPGVALCWSRDSRRLIFSAGQDKKSETVFAYLFDMDARRTEALTKLDLSWERHSAGIPSQGWSPNGLELVYMVSQKGGDQMLVYNLETKTSRVLVEGGNPVWSPKGDWIAYETAGSLRLISPDGQRKEILLQDPSPREDYIRGPILWSPDGAFLFFTRTLAPDPVAQLPHVMEVSTRREEELPADCCGGVYGFSLSWAGKDFSN